MHMSLSLSIARESLLGTVNTKRDDCQYTCFTLPGYIGYTIVPSSLLLFDQWTKGQLLTALLLSGVFAFDTFLREIGVISIQTLLSRNI